MQSTEIALKVEQAAASGTVGATAEVEADAEFSARVDAGTDSLQQPTKASIEFACRMAAEAITMHEMRPEGYLLLADCHTWVGHLGPAFWAYVAAFNLARPGSFEWAKAAFMAYDSVHDPTIPDRPADLRLPGWMTDPPRLLRVAEDVIAALGHDQPGAWRMKGDALKALGEERRADSAYQRARHELAARLRALGGVQEEPEAVRGDDGDGGAGDGTPRRPYGHVSAMLEHAMGNLPAIAGDGDGNPSYPLRNVAPMQSPPLRMVGVHGRWLGPADLDPQHRSPHMASG